MRLLLLAVFFSTALMSQAQEVPAPAPRQFMQITTIESVVAGGMGRSKMLITRHDGTQEERDLENLFSMGGINFKNIKENENAILKVLKQYTEEGWTLEKTIPMTLSPGNGGGGIFMTRYLLGRPETRKGF